MSVAIGYGIGTAFIANDGINKYAKAYIKAIESEGVILTTVQKKAIDTYVKDLLALNSIESGVINFETPSNGKIIIDYPIIGGTAATHALNLIDPRTVDAAYYITWVGSPTHSANGVTFSKTLSTYGRTHLIPSTYNKATVYIQAAFINRINGLATSDIDIFVIALLNGNADVQLSITNSPLSSIDYSQTFDAFNTLHTGGRNTMIGTDFIKDGIVHGTRENATTSKLLNNETVIKTLTSTTTIGSMSGITPELLIGGYTVGTQYNCAFPINGIVFGEGLSEATAKAYAAARNKLNTALGRANY